MDDTPLEYAFRELPSLAIVTHHRSIAIDFKLIKASVIRANKMMRVVKGLEIDIFEILGMRNLSAFVGEIFARSVELESAALLRRNPHQDGYPDLLMMDVEGAAHFETLTDRLREKGPFSPFATGGIEVKATCGSVPTPSTLAKKGRTKPGIGEQRVELLTGFDWKAHHRETNNLLGVLWDFIGGCPTVVAVFYSSNLEPKDWGAIVHPKAGGGRTTSVSIMNASGLMKMREGWLCVIDDERYRKIIRHLN